MLSEICAWLSSDIRGKAAVFGLKILVSVVRFRPRAPFKCPLCSVCCVNFSIGTRLTDFAVFSLSGTLVAQSVLYRRYRRAVLCVWRNFDLIGD